MRKHLKIVWLLLFALLLTSCSTPGSTPAATPTETPEPTPTTPPVSTPMPGQGERTVITVGMIDFSDTFPDDGQMRIEQAALTFNAGSKDYKVEIVYYGNFSRTNNDALLAVNAALSSSENVPDLLYLDGLPTDAYIQRGLLMDLYPFMDADYRLTREDLFPCIREASEMDGKIFYLSPDCMFTLYGGNSESLLTEDFADTEQVFRALEAHQDEGRTLIQDSGAYIAPNVLIDRFVDYESGTCSFQCEEFLHVLELVGSLPRSVDRRFPAGATDRSSSALWVTDKYSIVFSHILNRFTDYVALETLMEGDYVPVEYLFSDGKYALCNLETPVAIPTNAKHPEGAWEFIRHLFQEVDILDGDMPTSYISLEKILNQSKLPELWETQREDKKDVREQMRQDMSDPYTQFDWVQTYPYTEETYQEFLELLEKPMFLCLGWSENWKRTELQNIVYDEVDAFLTGTATAEQTAQALQSRVEIYLAEQT